jgi:hypothetical protein
MPFTAQDVFNDAVSLLAKWDLSDDNVYPWRTDNYRTVYPLVTRSAVQRNVTMLSASAASSDAPSFFDPGWVDVMAADHDGSIRGAPLVGPTGVFTDGWPAALASGTTTQKVTSITLGNPFSIDSQYIFTGITSIKRYNSSDVLKATGTAGTGVPADKLCSVSLDDRVPTAGDYSVCMIDPSNGSASVYLRASVVGGYKNPLEDTSGSGGTPGTTDYLIVTYTYYQVLGGHFDRRHKDIHKSENIYGNMYVDAYWYGAYSNGSDALDPTDSVQPNTATQWTNSDDACALPPGAFIKMLSNMGGLWMQKYAEIKLPWHSQNWFGPCGADRDVMIGQSCGSGAGDTIVATVNVYGGGTATQTFACPTEGSTLDIAAGLSPSGVVSVVRWNSGSVAKTGVLGTDYTVYEDGGGYWHVTLIGSNLPCQSDTCKLSGGNARWPLAWAIEGDRGFLAATDISDGTKTKVTLQSPALWLRVGDLVDFTDGSGTVTVGSKTVTDIDGVGDGKGGGTFFKFTGTVPSGTRVKSHGAPGFWWYDTDGKGEYLHIEYGFNYRDFVLTPTTRAYQLASYNMPQEVNAYAVTCDCLPFLQCFPAVVCYSPNYDPDHPDTPIDSFDNGTTYGFPEYRSTPGSGSFCLDEPYGAAWQGMFKQVMQDAWWYTPPQPCINTAEPGDEIVCGHECGWQPDSGDCGPDTCEDDAGTWSGTKYYAHPPMVEARCESNGNMQPAAWHGDTAPDVATIYHPTYGGGIFSTDTNDTGVGAGDLKYPSFTALQSSGADGIIFVPMQAVGEDGCDTGKVNSPSGCGSAKNTPQSIDDEWSPWNLWLRMQSCICASGRFAADYQKVIGCWMCGPEPSPSRVPALASAPTQLLPGAAPAGSSGSDSPASDSTGLIS